MVFQSRNELALNSTSEIEAKINSAIVNSNIDLLLIFRPTQLTFQDATLKTATYIITGTDTRTKQEIWKAEFTSSSSFGPSFFADKAATNIYEKLKSDHVI